MVEVNSLGDFQVTAEMPCDMTSFAQLLQFLSTGQHHQTNKQTKSPCLKMSPFATVERTRSRATRFHFIYLVKKEGEQDGRTMFKNT